MTKKLESLFNLPPADEVEAEIPTAESIEAHRTEIAAIDEAIDKIDAALPTVRDLETADSEMDSLAELAQTKFEELMDLGMQVEARYSGTIFQTAGVLLGHAITAKQAKLDKKLRMVDLQLKKMRLDQTASKKEPEEDAPVDGKGIVLDRNSLIAQIMSQSKKP
jgi:hypothetical protein